MLKPVAFAAREIRKAMMRRTRRMPKRKLPKKPNKSKTNKAIMSDEVTILDFY